MRKVYWAKILESLFQEVMASAQWPCLGKQGPPLPRPLKAPILDLLHEQYATQERHDEAEEPDDKYLQHAPNLHAVRSRWALSTLGQGLTVLPKKWMMNHYPSNGLKRLSLCDLSGLYSLTRQTEPFRDAEAVFSRCWEGRQSS